MAYIICQPCIGVKDTACVEVCPVDAIHPRKDEPEYENSDQLYINPSVCIDCGACESVCPVQAIYGEDSVPDEWKDFIKKNYEYYGQTPP